MDNAEGAHGNSVDDVWTLSNDRSECRKQHAPCTVRQAMASRVIVRGRFSRNRQTSATLARTPQVMDIAMPTSRMAGFGWISTTERPLVRTYLQGVNDDETGKESGVPVLCEPWDLEQRGERDDHAAEDGQIPVVRDG